MDFLNLNYFSIFFECYEFMIGEHFKTYFLNKIDEIMINILPIEYEFNINKNVDLPLKTFFYVETFIFLIFEELCKDKKTYLEIEVIQLLHNRKEEYIIDNNEKFLLYENEFEYVRQILFKFFIIDIIENKKYKNSIVKSYENNESSLFKSNLSQTNYLLFKKFELKDFISYFNDEKEIKFMIQIKFIEFLNLIQNENNKEAFCFWFLFFIPNTSLNISYYDYEYFTIDDVDFNFMDVNYKLFLTQQEYLFFNNTIVNKIKCENITLNIYDNIISTTKLINLIKKLSEENENNLRSKKSINKENIDFSLNYNILVINTYGKYSKNILTLQNLLSDKIKLKLVNSIFLNFYNFNHFEFNNLIKENNNFIENVVDDFFVLVDFLTEIIRISESNLIMLQLTIEGFSSYKSYYNIIMNKFETFLNETSLLFYFKNNNFLINFNDLNSVMKNSYNEYDKLIYSDSCWKFNSKKTLHKIDKINKNYNTENFGNNIIKLNNKKGNKNYITQFNIIETNLKILDNKVIDMFLLQKFTIKSITNLRLGIFKNFEELVIFVSKFNFNNFSKLQKIILYLESNIGLNNENLDKFFNLNWPKSELKTIKIIFENFYDKMSINIFDLYHKIILKKFLKNSIINFIGFIKIENYLIYKLNSDNLSTIAFDIPNNFKGKIKKSNIKNEKIIKDFFSSTCITEYFDWKKIMAIIFTINKNNNLQKIKSNFSIIQYIIQFLKSRRVIYQDFNNSLKIYKYYKEILSK